MYTHFLLGNLMIERSARIKRGRTPLDLIARHAINEHGCITPEEAQLNFRSMFDCGPILSRYRVHPTDITAGFVVVKTDEGWTETKVSLEE
jgi:hypothetical protein